MANNSRNRPYPALKLREVTGLNQTEFWGKVHITQSAGSRFETGRPMHPTVRALLGYVYLGEKIARHRS